MVRSKKKKAAEQPDPETQAGSPEATEQQAMSAPEEARAPDAEAATVPLERFQRLQADFENFRKRTLRERTDLYRRANEDIMEALLPVLDHLDLALKAASDHGVDAVADGFRLVAEQLRSALGKFGLTLIDGQDQLFDPNLHEAVSHLPSESTPENHVLVQTRPGYRLGDYLLRPAQVVVSSGAAAPAAGNGKDED